MQPDVSNPPSVGRTQTRVEREEQRPAEGMQPIDLLYSALDTTTIAVGRVAGFIVSQPMIVASIIIGMIGAIAGIRIAQYQAMRQRRNLYERAMDRIGEFGANMADLLSRRPKTPTEVLMERGRDISAAVGLAPTMIGRRPRAAHPFRQAGYVLSFVPAAIVLMRNPMARDIGFRLLARRMMARR